MISPISKSFESLHPITSLNHHLTGYFMENFTISIVLVINFIFLKLDINTVAAGGGSRLFFRAGMFVVGPESAGAHPGPVCYRKSKSLLNLFVFMGLFLYRDWQEYFLLRFNS